MPSDAPKCRASRYVVMIRKILPIVLCVLIGGMMACSSSNNQVAVKNEAGLLIENFTETVDGEKTGPYTKYDEQGGIKETGFYVNGSTDGVRNVFYPGTDQINFSENYQDGTFQGKYQYFYEDGTLQLEGSYESGVMLGNWNGYYENGQLKEVVAFKDNQENGPFIEYYENGNLKAEGNYYNGDNEHGLLKLYDEAGILERKMECDSGRCQTIWKVDSAE